MSLTNTTAAQRYCPKNSFHPSPPSRPGLDTTTSNTYVDLLRIVSPRPSLPDRSLHGHHPQAWPQNGKRPPSHVLHALLVLFHAGFLRPFKRRLVQQQIPPWLPPGPQHQTYSTIFKTALRTSIHHHRHIPKSTVPSPWYQRTGAKKGGKLGRHSCFGSIP